MNKAFTKESDYDPSLDIVARPRDVLPPGVRNYITPRGADRLRGELRELTEVARPRVTEVLSELAGGGRTEDPAHADAKRRLREVDRQIAWLVERVSNLEIVDPAQQPADEVRFGARVTVMDESDEQRTWWIVGIDEANPSSGAISWISPIARALLSRQEGDEVTLQLPRGRSTLEILAIDYDTE